MGPRTVGGLNPSELSQPVLVKREVKGADGTWHGHMHLYLPLKITYET